MGNNKILSKLKSWIKKIPFTIPIYYFLQYDLPFLFYSGPEVISIQGSKMHLDIHAPDPSLRMTFRAYVKNKVHEKVTTNIIKQILNENETYLDLGANIGYFSLLASKIVGPNGKVFAFEPEPRNFKFLTINRGLNNYSQLTLVNKAASNIDGRTSLYICPYDTGHHTINQNDGIKSYTTNIDYQPEKISSLEIETVTIDKFLGTNGVTKVDLIKMDVEGAELLAFKGMGNTLKNINLKMIIEFFPLLIEKMKCSPLELLNMLMADYCFDIYEIADDYYSKRHVGKKILTKIEDPQNLMIRYKENTMFHVNLLLIKQGHPQHDRYANLEL